MLYETVMKLCDFYSLKIVNVKLKKDAILHKKPKVSVLDTFFRERKIKTASVVIEKCLLKTPVCVAFNSSMLLKYTHRPVRKSKANGVLFIQRSNLYKRT